MRTNRCVIHNFDSLMDCRRWVFTCLVIASHSLPFGERWCSSTSLEDHRFRKSAKMIDSRQLLGEVAHESHNMPTACFLLILEWYANISVAVPYLLMNVSFVLAAAAEEHIREETLSLSFKRFFSSSNTSSTLWIKLFSLFSKICRISKNRFLISFLIRSFSLSK